MKVFQSITEPEVAALLSHGAVGVLSSDTVYGLMCSAADAAAVARLYGLKRREHKPGTVIAATIDQLVTLGIKRRYLTAVEQFWPGAVSVVVPCEPELSYLDRGLNSLAVRLPADKSLQTLLEQTGPLLTTSANQPGEPVANTIPEARVYFGETVDFYVGGGNLSGREPSTIIRIVDDAIEVLRAGAVKINDQ